MLNKVFSGKAFDSRIRSDSVTKKELALGYLIGPSLVMTVNAIVMGFVNNFYTDVVQIGYLWGGAFLVIMPIICNVVDAFTNIIMGRWLDKTRNRQGKARPWLLLSLPFLVISGALMYIVPNGSDTLKVIWVTFAYLLYDSVAFTIFNMCYMAMVPLSTSNVKERDGVGMMTNVAINVIPGMLAALLFPMVVMPMLSTDRTAWLNCMVIVSLLCVPGIILTYFYTRERVTEAALGQEQDVPMKDQLKACFRSREWRLIMGFLVCHIVISAFVVASRLYYANWVLAENYEGGAQAYSLMNIIGQSPLGLGIFIVWPLTKKFGKRKVLLFSSILMFAGALLGFFTATNFVLVMIALIIQSFGGLANTYLTNALHADGIDAVARESGVRVEGFSCSVLAIVSTVATGIGTGVLNWGLAAFKYAPPVADADGVIRTVQNQAIKNFLVFMFFGVFIIDAIVEFFLMLFYKPAQAESVVE